MGLAASLGILLGGAWLLARLLRPTPLPPLLGMIGAGVLVGNLLPDLTPLGPALPWNLGDVSSPIRLAVLAVVLLRAGLGLAAEDLRRAGGLALRLGALPLLGDAALLTASGMLLLGLTLPVAMVLAFTVAAISPAIVIPGVLDLLNARRGPSRRVPAALLAGAPLDNIFCLLALGVALDLALESGPGGTWRALLGVPWRIGGGVLLGVAVGLAQRPLLGALPARLEAWLLWAAAGGLIALGRWLDLSFVLSIIAQGATLRAGQALKAERASAHLADIWRWAQYALFGLIGAALDVAPLAEIGGLVVGVVALGQLGRAAGALLATARQGLSGRERVACVLSYVPKATIQAAFGGLALDRGLPEGGLILGTAVLSVALCAPTGVVALTRGAARLLPGHTAEQRAAEQHTQAAGENRPDESRTKNCGM